MGPVFKASVWLLLLTSHALAGRIPQQGVSGDKFKSKENLKVAKSLLFDIPAKNRESPRDQAVRSYYEDENVRILDRETEVTVSTPVKGCILDHHVSKPENSASTAAPYHHHELPANSHGLSSPVPAPRPFPSGTPANFQQTHLSTQHFATPSQNQYLGVHQLPIANTDTFAPTTTPRTTTTMHVPVTTWRTTFQPFPVAPAAKEDCSHGTAELQQFTPDRLFEAEQNEVSLPFRAVGVNDDDVEINELTEFGHGFRPTNAFDEVVLVFQNEAPSKFGAFNANKQAEEDHTTVTEAPEVQQLFTFQPEVTFAPSRLQNERNEFYQDKRGMGHLYDQSQTQKFIQDRPIVHHEQIQDRPTFSHSQVENRPVLPHSLVQERPVVSNVHVQGRPSLPAQRVQQLAVPCSGEQHVAPVQETVSFTHGPSNSRPLANSGNQAGYESGPNEPAATTPSSAFQELFNTMRQPVVTQQLNLPLVVPQRRVQNNDHGIEYGQASQHPLASLTQDIGHSASFKALNQINGGHFSREESQGIKSHPNPGQNEVSFGHLQAQVAEMQYRKQVENEERNWDMASRQQKGSTVHELQFNSRSDGPKPSKADAWRYR